MSGNALEFNSEIFAFSLFLARSVSFSPSPRPSKQAGFPLENPPISYAKP
jgi:hypothetical protein